MRKAYRMKMSSRGQVVLPAALREQVGLAGGDELSVQELAGREVAAEKREATAFELAVAGIRRHLDNLGVTEADLEEALEEVKQELYEETYGRREAQQAVS